MMARCARFPLILLLCAVLAGCARDRRPAGAAPTDETLRQCLGGLTDAGVRYTRLPDQDFGGGCSVRGSVRLDDIGLPTTNLGAMQCPLARHFAAWATYAVRPAARQVYGQEAVRIETFGTYACRNVNGAASGRLSQHAYANAVDVAAVVLADGRRVSVLRGWTGEARDQQFLRLVRASACRRFGTVLSPDYNSLHADHFHFDMGGQGFCR